MDSFILVVIILSSVLILSGFFFLFRIKACNNYGLNTKYPEISIIIPARNEENNIGRLIESINIQQLDQIEIIVVNDESSDRTRSVSIEKGAMVFDSKPLPDDWKGKPWACFQGAKIASGDIFIFLDADTFLEPGGLSKIIDSFLFETEKFPKGKKPVMSILPYHKIHKFYEGFSSIFNIIMIGAMNAFTPFNSLKPTGLFGQSLIIGRDEYFLIGGHESVKDKILENVFMADKFKMLGINLLCFGGIGSLSFRMYPDGFKSLVDGWTKAFASGASKTSLISMASIILWISGGFTITIFLIHSIIITDYLLFSSVLYIIFSLQFYWMLNRIGTFQIFTAALFPFQLLFFVIVFCRSSYYQIAGRKIQWKSRNVGS